MDMVLKVAYVPQISGDFIKIYCMNRGIKSRTQRSGYNVLLFLHCSEITQLCRKWVCCIKTS